MHSLELLEVVVVDVVLEPVDALVPDVDEGITLVLLSPPPAQADNSAALPPPMSESAWRRAINM